MRNGIIVCRLSLIKTYLLGFHVLRKLFRDSAPLTQKLSLSDGAQKLKTKRKPDFRTFRTLISLHVSLYILRLTFAVFRRRFVSQRRMYD